MGEMSFLMHLDQQLFLTAPVDKHKNKVFPF